MPSPAVYSQLGRRERQLMEIVYRRGRSTAAEILEELPDPPSYSAVRGMLRLLEDKGYLKHEQEGPRYIYLATADVKNVSKSAVRDLVRTFFDDSASAAVAAMIGQYEGHLTDADLDRLESLIERARTCNSRRMVATAAHLTSCLAATAGAAVGALGAEAPALLPAARCQSPGRGAAPVPARGGAMPARAQPRFRPRGALQEGDGSRGPHGADRPQLQPLPQYTLGSELRAKSREVVEAIIQANSRVEKLPHLVELREKLEGLQVLLRIAKEVRAFASFNSHAYACGQCLQWSAMRHVRRWPK